jgi:hypothetical protein
MQVLNIKTTGSVPSGTFYIGRSNPKVGIGSALGNPFVMGKDGNRDEVCAKYRKWLWAQLENYDPTKPLTPALNSLKYLCLTKPDLVCWCAPAKCHGDVLKNCVTWLTEGEGQQHSFYIHAVKPMLSCYV